MAVLTQKSSKPFIPHPISPDPIQGVIVGITPPVTKPDSFNPGKEKTTIKVCIETQMKDEEGKPCYVWTKPMSLSFVPPSKHPASALYLFVEKVAGPIGPDDVFDSDQQQGIIIIGKPVKLIVEHTKKDDEIYANISWFSADKGNAPYVASGQYKAKAADYQQPNKEYSKAAAPTAAAPEAEPWHETKIHVGQYAGQKLAGIPAAGVKALITHWLPNAGTTADDKRLAAALREANEALMAAEAAASAASAPAF